MNRLPDLARHGRWAALLWVILVPRPASSSSAGEEYLSGILGVEPNILFLVDRSNPMAATCPVRPGSDGSTSTDPCIADVAQAIDEVVGHYDWARYGVALTSRWKFVDTFTPLVPLGASQAEVSAALATLTASATTTRNLGEALASLADDYFVLTAVDDATDSDGDGRAADFNRAPVQYRCQENHVIVLTVDRPHDDTRVPASRSPSVASDVICDEYGIVVSPDSECQYDNVVASLYDSDLRPDLSGTQNLVVHTIAIGLTPETVAEALFQSAEAQTGSDGVYHVAGDADEILSAILLVLQDIRSGSYSRSAPVITPEADALVYSFYELDGSEQLGRGHVRAYRLGTDPTDPETYGDIVPLAGSPYDDYGGALWDAGVLLESRPAASGETNPGLLEGQGTRDVFTFVDEMVGTPLGAEALARRRMDFDASFASALAADPGRLDLFLDVSATAAPPCADDPTYDLDGDCIVDGSDLQVLIDFTRGVATATYRYSGLERGSWKLGDAPNATPAVVTPRNDAFTVDPSYRNFLLTQRSDPHVPSMVYATANDGMLHAFFLEDDPATAHAEQGQEAWAWIPSYVLYREHEAAWAGRLIDTALYGRTLLFDGSPVVADVWIDEDDDGVRDCPEAYLSVGDLAGACEWHRVLVVRQGRGGPVTLALDVTDPLDPRYLWEQVDPRMPPAQGYGVDRPVIARVWDAREPDLPVPRWVALWSSGRAVPWSVGSGYYDATEANLYMWAVGDDYFYGTSAQWNANQALLDATGAATWTESGGFRLDEDGSAGHPESHVLGSLLDSDADGNDEYGYVSATITAVDVDSDGDADVLYFPVSTTYGSAEDGDVPGSSHPETGDTWMWKALVDPSAPDEIAWCPTAFFDPRTVTPDLARPEVFYAATASWFSDGTLGLYWGTGSPYQTDTTSPGYFFAIRDPTPASCSVGEPLLCNGVNGFFALDPGEGLTGDPVVYAGVVYFSTYVPSADRCDLGEGRLYGLRYDDCSQGLDTTGDGAAGAEDAFYTVVGSYPSKPVVTDQGTVLVGGLDITGRDVGVQRIDGATDPFLGTTSITWMEIY
ncbi:MAG: hypothetical protein JXB39_10290 [Deltaproteobacteria bacterium]|nr:hypothetical protein [Deltaproteobacteria bacterium]